MRYDYQATKKTPAEKIGNFQLLKHRAYEAIRQRIIDLTLRPNEQLVEQRLTEQLGFSKSPIREAIQRLEQDGLVYSLPFKGCFVAEITEQEIREIFQLREALEAFCIKIGCETFSKKEIQEIKKFFEKAEKALGDENLKECYVFDRQLHELLISHSKNAKIIQTYSTLKDHLYRYWNISTLISGRVAKSHEQHLLIVEALEQRDKMLAETRISDHLKSILEDFVRSNEFKFFCRR
jgi:DNA-binding GntR family transcriptional regulator